MNQTNCRTRTTIKTPARVSGWGFFLTGLMVMPIVVGCGGGHGTDTKKSLENPERRHILQMLSVYRAYLSAHHSKPPASPQALKDWAQKEGKEKLQITDSLEDALTSPRDGQPYAFVPPPKRKMGPQTFMVYEQQGKGGKHYFAGEMGVVGEMDDKEISDAVQSAK
jgi:hypothetical protein